MLIGTNYNFNGNQLLNAVVHQATAAPSSPQEGMIYTNTTAHTFNAYLNGTWVSFLTSASGTLSGTGGTNYASYWTNSTTLAGIAVNSGILAHDNTGVPAAVTSTVPGAILVASATRPLFSNCTILPNTTGFAITGGSTTAKTLTVSNTLTLAGTDSSTLNIGAGGTLGTAAFTSATAYEAALGNPATSGYVLSSTTDGVRSWVANGFQNPMTTLGDLLYGGASGAATRLAGPTVAGTYILTETPTGSAAVAPVWTNANTLTVAKATNLVGAAWGIPYQSATDTTSFVAQPGAAGRVLLSGANNAAPSWSAGTLTLPASGSLTIPAFAVSFSNAFATTGAFSTSLTQSANLTLALPPVATANMVYNTAAPGANNQLVYAANTSNAISYITAPAALSVLTQSSNAAAPAWTTATGTGSPVMGTDPTITLNSSNKLILNFTPALGTDAVNKTYVDNIALGLNDWKQSVRAATTANVTLASAAPNTLDGVTLATNDRILVKNQTAPAENGIYVVTTLGTGANGVWTRATDADTSAKVTTGMYVYVEEGTTAGRSQWVLSTPGPITLGTTGLTFVKFNGGATLTAGNGIDITGDTLSVKVNASTTYLQYGILYHDTTTTISRLALPGTANLALAGATAGAPYWSTLVITPTGGSNATLSIAAGATLATTGAFVTTLASSANATITLPGASGTLLYYTSAPAQYGVPYANAASGLIAYTAVNTTSTNNFLRQVSGGAPTFAALTSTDITTALAFTPVKKFTTTITGAGPTFSITGATHGITNQYMIVKVYDTNLATTNSTQEVQCDVAINYTTKDITLSFGYGVPGSGTYTVIIMG
jgi:hypothetical protein